MAFNAELKENSKLDGIRLKLFNNGDLDAIHAAAMHLLGHVGMKVENQVAVQTFADHGCSVKNCGEYWLVKLPQNLVEDCVRLAPERVVAWGRDRDHDFALEPGRIGFAPIGECLNVIDPHTRICRPAVKRDIANWAKVIDVLDEFAIIHNPANCSDVPK